MFRALWLFDTCLVLAVFSGFLFYLFRGPLTTLITRTWLGILGSLVLTLLAAAWLKINNYSGLAMGLLLLMAAPGLVYLGLILATRIFRPGLKHT